MTVFETFLIPILSCILIPMMFYVEYVTKKREWKQKELNKFKVGWEEEK